MDTRMTLSPSNLRKSILAKRVCKKEKNDALCAQLTLVLDWGFWHQCFTKYWRVLVKPKLLDFNCRWINSSILLDFNILQIYFLRKIFYKFFSTFTSIQTNPKKIYVTNIKFKRWFFSLILLKKLVSLLFLDNQLIK